MKYFIIYETKNLKNNKLYRGCHQTNDLNDGYLGSGKTFLKALKKYGRHNFKRKILKLCKNVEEMIYYESIYINEEWVNRIDTYNLQTGGLNYGILCDESKQKISLSIKSLHKKGVYKYKNKKKFLMSEETKQKISQSLIKRYLIIDHPNKGKSPWNKGKTGYQISWNKGIKTGSLQQETKDKISKSLKNFYETTHGNRKGYSPWCAGTKGQGVVKAWNKGIPSPKSSCCFCGKMVDRLNMKKWHGENCKHNLTKNKNSV